MRLHTRAQLALLAASAVLLSGCGAGYKLDWFLYVPERVDSYALRPQGRTPEETVTADRIEPIPLGAIKTEDGVSLGAVYVKASEQPPRGYLIFFHGKGGNLDSTMPRLKRYANLGYDTLGFDYRGFGMSSDVEITEAGIGLDGRAALAYMKERLGPANSERLFLAGQSFGTAPATQLAEVEPPRCLIIESGFASLGEFTSESTQMDFPREFITRDGWYTYKRLRNVHVPVLVLHGLNDDLIRPDHARINSANANEPKRLELIEGGGHSDLPEVMGQGYADLLHAFVEEAIPALR